MFFKSIKLVGSIYYKFTILADQIKTNKINRERGDYLI
jgi:hypothetical protein